MPDNLVDEPGDAACWLHRLCPECGAMPTGEQQQRCWRCGAPVEDPSTSSEGVPRC